VQKSYDCTFLTENGGLILNALPKVSLYDQDHLIDSLLPALNQLRTGNDRRKGAPALIVQMGNSLFHNE
jgi:hypothetical protein